MIVVTSIGNRDVRYQIPGETRFCNLGGPQTASADVGRLAKHLRCAATLREISQTLLDRYDQVESRLRFPILRPGLARALADGRPIDRLLMIVTDQKAAPHRDNDTVFCGELLARLTRLTWSEDQIRTVEPHFIKVKEGPNKTDEMYRLVRDQLATRVPPESVEAFYALPSPGIPAITDAVRHAGMNLYRGRCTVIQVEQPTDDPDGAAEGPTRMLSMDPYVKDAVRRGIQALVEHGNYAGSLNMLNEFGQEEWSPALLHLLGHARARMNLDLSAAEKEATLVCGASSVSTALGQCLRVPRDFLGRTNEVCFLIAEALKHERYPDALFRIALFRESCNALFTMGALGKEFQVYLNEPLPVHLIEKRWPDLARQLKGQESRQVQRNGVWAWPLFEGPDKRTVFNFAVKVCEDGGDAWQEASGLVRWPLLMKFAELRNKAIHAPTGVSRKQLETPIKKYLRKHDIDERPLVFLLRQLDNTIASLFRCFDRKPTPNPYPGLEREILLALDGGTGDHAASNDA